MVVIKLRDVTSIRKKIVNGLKAYSPEFKTVKVYECDGARYIHSVSDESQILSISCPDGKVPEHYIILGIKDILKMDLVDVMINVRVSGVVIIREKDDTIPVFAH